jgi:hypothetical protein
MRLKKAWIIVSAVLAAALWAPAIRAGDFDWMKDFNLRAEADPSGFRAQLATRFKVGDAEINAVIGNMKRPADAYMVLRLGEMSSRSPEYVMDRYHAEKGKGWGVLAKSLGIKPGSSEFHALKRGDDLSHGGGKGKGSMGKHQNKGKGKNKG